MIGKQKPGTSGKADRSVLRLKRADHRESAHKEPERAPGRAHTCHLIEPLPNESRLSCVASAGRRKRSALRDRLAGAQTHAFL